MKEKPFDYMKYGLRYLSDDIREIKDLEQKAKTDIQAAYCLEQEYRNVEESGGAGVNDDLNGRQSRAVTERAFGAPNAVRSASQKFPWTKSAGIFYLLPLHYSLSTNTAHSGVFWEVRSNSE